MTEPDAPPALVEYLFDVIQAAVAQITIAAGSAYIDPTEKNLYIIASVIANTLTDLVSLGRVYKMPLGGWAFNRARPTEGTDENEDVYLEEFRGMQDKTGIN